MQLNRVTEVDDRVPVRRALISLADKRGLPELIRGLWQWCEELVVVSTGGTYSAIRTIAEELGRTEQLTSVTDYTGQPEMQGGLVKTLDFRLYLGLLAERYNEEHNADIERTGSWWFDLTICNFYPFAEAAAGEHTVEDLRTHIDIGGPTMVRASAKNFLRVASVVHPEEYEPLIGHLREHGGATTLAYRAALASRAFAYTAAYEAAISAALSDEIAASVSSTYRIASEGDAR